MRYKKILVMIGIIVFLFIFASPHAEAEILFSNYYKLKDSEPFKIYIAGVGVGYSWANVVMREEGREPLYCPPKKLAIQNDNYLDILDKEIKSVSSTKTIPPNTAIEMILLIGLKKTFPCE